MTERVHETLGAVTRSVTAHHDNDRTRFEIIASRAYVADIDDLWEALTSPARLEQWFLPVSGDLRKGGNYQFEGNAGGEIQECDAPEHLLVSWGMREDTSLVDLRLVEVESGRVQFTLKHTGEVAGEFWEQYGPGAVGIGWDMSLFGLAENLRPDPDVTRANFEPWMTSDEGKDFSRQSGEAWRDAAIAGGEDREAADRACAVVVAAYTGEAAPEG